MKQNSDNNDNTGGRGDAGRRDDGRSAGVPRGEVGRTEAVELEARIVAWVAGELAELDRAELERLVAGRPELAKFRERMELVRELVTEAVKAENEPLRISAERREKLLRTPGASGDVLPLREQAVVLPSPTPWWRGRNRYPYFGVAGLLAGAAAAVAVIFFQQPVYEATAEMQFMRADTMVQQAQVMDADIRSAGIGPLVGVRRAGEAKFKAVELVAGNAPPPTSAVRALSSQADRAKDREAVTMEAPSLSAPAAPERLDVAQKARRETPNSDSAYNNPGARGLQLSTLGERIETFQFAPDGMSVAGTTSAATMIVGTKTFEGRVSVDGGNIAGGLAVADATSGAAAANFGAVPPPAVEDAGTVRLAIGFDAFDATSDREARTQSREVKVIEDVAKKAEQARVNERDDAPAVRARPEVKAAEPEEAATAQEPFSTFSLHVSDVSFRLAREAVAARARGGNAAMPNIRPEEFYNAFRYGDPLPGTEEKIAARIEQAAHPVLQQRNLVRIALRVAATGRAAAQPLRLTVLLDTSGSMEREDRAAAVRRALRELAALLRPTDRVTLVGFARTPRLLAEAVPGNQAGTLVELAARTPAEGGTNFEAALRLGGELARRHRMEGAQNRVVLFTDGAANLGAAEPAQLAAQVAAWRREGIAFDACGVGLDGLDDDVLEALARGGDGRYSVLGGGGEAEAAEYAQQLAGALRPAAENVKVQVRFNAARVGRYRLIGFEQHRLATEDFRNDRVDAAELAAEENAVALYQVEVLPQGAGELGEVFVRFRDAATGQMVERAWPIAHEAAAPAFARAAPALQLAGTAALLADKLRETPLARQFTLAELAGPVAAVRAHYAREPRVQELAAMYDQMRRILRE